MSGRPAPSGDHSAACRERIGNEMRKDPKEAKAVFNAEEKRNKFLDSEIARVEDYKRGGGIVVAEEGNTENSSSGMT